MSTQIAVRLNEGTVRMMDELVASGVEKSRASLVERALQREIRRQLALRDVEILRAVGPEDDLDELVAWSAKHFTMDE